MKLSPLDIRKHEFARKLRGYDPEEVKAFTEMVSRQWEEVLDDLRHARDRVRELEGKIAHYEKVESALHEALESARSGAKRTQEQAEERARLIVEEAELKAEQRLQEANQRQGQLRHDVVNLTRRQDEIVARLRHFLMSELEILARHEEDRPIGFMQLMPSQPAESLPSPSEPARAPASPRDAEAAQGPQGREGRAERAEPAAEAAQEQEHSETTYSDFYARAAEAEHGAGDPEDIEGEPEDVEDDEEPTWTLRSIVGGQEDEDEEPEQATAPNSEKERIRRILEDLD